jgi:N-acetylated-alpha-linked acidic dipeptidase
MIGSTEWVEEFAPWLRQTTITYLNLDIAVAGPLPGAGATPELRTLALDVMKKVVYGNRTLYDAWDELNFFRPETNGFTNLGSGSDYTAFLQLGIGALDFGMDADYDTPVYHYHSTYDSFHWMKTIDPDYSLHVTTARFMTLLTYHLADDVLIPFDMVAYARNINYWIRDQIIETLWVNSGFRYGNLQVKIAILPLSQAAKNFQKVANAFMEVTSREEFLNNTKQVKEANTSLRDVQRVFIREKGLPGRPFYKNGLYAPSRDDGYRAQVLPGSMEALHDRNFTACREWNTWLADALNEASKLLAKSL